MAPQPGDYTVTKQRFSAFFATDLDIILRGLGTKNVYLTGTQYPNCIRSTALDSMSLDYNTIVVTDCCSAASEDVAKANIYDLQNMGIACVTVGKVCVDGIGVGGGIGNQDSQIAKYIVDTFNQLINV
ncbi:MAG: cysteine hydrolase [Muribaculaceae bacterium]|nr:cysteine hydrolase [Muribaculaceae bacterium]